MMGTPGPGAIAGAIFGGLLGGLTGWLFGAFVGAWLKEAVGGDRPWLVVYGLVAIGCCAFWMFRESRGWWNLHWMTALTEGLIVAWPGWWIVSRLYGVVAAQRASESPQRKEARLMPDERIRSQVPAPTAPSGDPVWFVLSHGQESGPFTTQELQAKAATGAVGPEDLVRNQQCPWTPAEQWAFLVASLSAKSSAQASQVTNEGLQREEGRSMPDEHITSSQPSPRNDGALVRLRTWVRQHPLSAGVTTLAVLFALFVWPTPYRFEHVGSTVWRVNRLTGSAERIIPPPAPPEPPKPPSPPTPRY
jgi:hypothetical protein